MRRLSACLVLAALLAGCTAATLPPAPPAPALANAPDALEGVALEGGELLSRDDASVTFLWRGGLEGAVMGPGVSYYPLDPVVAAFTPPAGAFFSLSTEGTADVPLSVELREAEGHLLCAAPADGATCLTMARVDEPAGAWTLRVRERATSPPGAPFELAVTVRLVEPAGGGLPALPANAPAPTRAWLAPVMVEDVPLHEPALDVAPDGTMYVSGYGNEAGVLWRSTDGGASFARVPIVDVAYCNNAADELAVLADALAPREGAFHWGCGDIDVAVSGEHVYFANHWNGEAVHASHDGGATWTSSLAASAEPARTDRAWLAADGINAWLAFNSGRPDVLPGDAIGRTVVSRTTDGGATWLQVGQTTGWCLPGAFARSSADGRLYLGTCDDEGVAVAASGDGGLTWTWHSVAARSGAHERLCYTCGILTALDVDEAGNVHVAWADPSAGTFDVWHASSRDGAATWSAPTRVNAAPGAHVMPWLDAGKEGHVAIAWYGAATARDPSEAEDAVWYAHVAESWDALADAPTWEEQVVSRTPAQYGPICLNGASCEAGRDLGDYLHVAFDAEEDPVVAYADARAGTQWNELSRVMVVTSSGRP